MLCKNFCFVWETVHEEPTLDVYYNEIQSLKETVKLLRKEKSENDGSKALKIENESSKFTTLLDLSRFWAIVKICPTYETNVKKNKSQCREESKCKMRGA